MVLYRSKGKEAYLKIREKVMEEEKISKQKKKFSEKVATLVTGKTYETRQKQKKAKAELMIKVRAARSKAYQKEFLKQSKKAAIKKARQRFAPKKAGTGQMSPEARSLIYGESKPTKKKKGKSEFDKLMWGS